jgi:lipoprotein-anchoring transpeptidase ErfK/SrfK
LRVVSDLLPNNRSGWIAAEGAPVRSTRLMVRIDLSERRLTVLLGSSVLRHARVAVGAPGSPTPTGVFSITDKLDSSDHAGWVSAYGCCVLALSGHQTRLPSEWSSGDRLAIHGGGGLGSAVSAGCMHAKEKFLRYLMQKLPLGTLVRIEA